MSIMQRPSLWFVSSFLQWWGAVRYKSTLMWTFKSNDICLEVQRYCSYQLNVHICLGDKKNEQCVPGTQESLQLNENPYLVSVAHQTLHLLTSITAREQHRWIYVLKTLLWSNLVNSMCLYPLNVTFVSCHVFTVVFFCIFSLPYLYIIYTYHSSKSSQFHTSQSL